MLLVQRPNYKMGYHCIKRLCHIEGIDFKKLPEDARKMKIGFVVGEIIVSIIEVDEKIKF